MSKFRKKTATKIIKCPIGEGKHSDGSRWVVQWGSLNAGPGAAGRVKRLFRVVGEKLPFGAIDYVDKQLRSQQIPREGVYVAHDSMGCARYIGRGKIFPRLRACRDNHKLQVLYFSSYIVEEKKHGREIETLLIHAAGPLLEFNTKKKRTTTSAGSILDYEAGTKFFELHSKKGKKPKE